MSELPQATSAAPMAYSVDAQLVPSSRFYEVACDPRRHVVVEACAGAGKTWMLVSRILRALLDGAEPQQILAITFTKKAAAEMRTRLQQWVESFASLTDDKLNQELQIRGVSSGDFAKLRERMRGLDERLLRSTQPLQIRTFHSWFAQLTRAAPLRVRHELGLPASYELLEDDSQITEAVWPRFWARVQERPELSEALRESMAAHGRSNIIKALDAVIGKRAEFAAADAAGVLETSVPHFAQQFQQEFGAFGALAHPDDVFAHGSVQTLLRNAAIAMGQGKIKTLVADAAALERACTEGRWSDAPSVLLTDKGEISKRLVKGEMSPEQQATVQQARELCALVVRARIQHAAWLHQQRMTQLARALLNEFAQTKRERGWVDMGDIEQVAHRLLGDETMGAWLQEVLDWRVRHLLVDEFQDTNPLQWQVLHGWLQSYAGAASDAPSVFIVGDPKQSIYRFRRADPQVFAAARDFVRQGLQGHWLSCEHTRRNAQAIIGLTNAVMAQAKEEQLMLGFRTHTTDSAELGEVLALPLVTIPEQDASGSNTAASNWRDSLKQPREQADEHVRQLEARQAAAWVAQRVAAGEKPSEFMVLARRNERLARMAQELRACGVPCVRADQETLYDAPEVQDMVALLECLLQPTNDLALARALKSPVFGQDDAALMRIAVSVRKTNPPQSWRDAVRQIGLITPGGRDIARQLDEWQGWLAQWPVHDALSLMMDECKALERFALAVPLALQARVQANLKALLGASLSVGGGRFISAREFVRSLKAGRVKAAGLEMSNAVKLLTIHKAKGLEASHVLLLDTLPAADRSESMGIVFKWPAHHHEPQTFAFVTSKSKPAESLRELVNDERSEDAREDMHCLYVAMTRAKKCLVVSASQGKKSAVSGSWYERLVQPNRVAQLEPTTPLKPVAASGDSLVTLPQLPAWNGSQFLVFASPTHVSGAGVLEGEVEPEKPDSSAQAQIGLALHRLLQSVPLLDVDANEHVRWQATSAQLEALCREYAIDAAQAELVSTSARRVVQAQHWLWDLARVAWHANEMELWSGGSVMRLDRVVRVQGGDSQTEWWVIDYKSTSQPFSKPELIDQLRSYQRVLGVSLGASVRAAFVTASGELFELPQQNTV